MPSYLFHVAFDLTSDTNIAPTTQETLFPSWSPPPHTDIFSTNLPVHQVSAWRQSGSGHKRSKTTSSKSEYPESPAPGKQLRHVRQLSQRTTKDIGRPDRETVFTAAQDFSAKSSSDSSTARDWRFDRISIESVDMEVRDLEVTARPSGGDDVSSGMDVLSNSHGLATKGVYVPSNPKNTEIGWGVVRLYRDSQENQAIDDETSSIASSGSDTVDASKSSDFKDDEYTTLCILAVPSYMTPSDLLGFVGEKTREEVSHFRLIRSARANKYMVLMKFKEARNAKRWRREWNGKLFNSMEVRLKCLRTVIYSLTLISQRIVMLYTSSRLNFARMTTIMDLPATQTWSTIPSRPTLGHSLMCLYLQHPRVGNHPLSLLLCQPNPSLLRRRPLWNCRPVLCASSAWMKRPAC